MATATQALQHYAEHFSGLEKSTAGAPSWLHQLRQNGFARFSETGFPTPREEDWRFTNLSPIAQTPFRLLRNGHRLPSEADVSEHRIAGAACELVFIDGRWAASLSSARHLPKGLHLGSLAAEMATNPGSIESHLGHYLNIQRDPFAALNTAFLEDGAYVHLSKGVVLESPIHLLFISTAHEIPVVTHPRNLIIAGEDSQATIIEDYISMGRGERGLCNTVTELLAQDHSVIAHYMIEKEHEQAFNVSTLRIQQGRAADVASHAVLAGGELVRNNVHPVLAGEGGECLINGLFLGRNRQHLDNYMLVEHASPHCSSRQFYNGILDGHAHGVFHGRIIVHKSAQKTDAKQTNRNLLLSDTAQIDTKPQLEIYADDVKCTHGATIGQIEEDALFYLRSRGMEEGSARRLLLFAFASECLDRMRTGPARTYVENLIQHNLAYLGDASRHQEQAS
ncbi:MAG TPA: Fe-S cluster assembly protein SufD [Candidatus Acidoferrales bacterium]|nr:Fe-S cluster assembly protein SufD [Candidatus Acidoferrales bacterium]